MIIKEMFYIRVITKLPNSEQSYKEKVKTHNYINRQNQSTNRLKPGCMVMHGTAGLVSRKTRKVK
jgi:hypothetical protein